MNWLSKKQLLTCCIAFYHSLMKKKSVCYRQAKLFSRIWRNNRVFWIYYFSFQHFLFYVHVYVYILYIDKFHLFRFHRRNWKMIIILIIFNFKFTKSFVKNKKNIENYVCFWLFKQILAQGLKIIIMSEIGQRLILT